MGLDIYFSKAKALAAGLVIRQETNGSTEDIANSVALGDQENPEYLEWLRKMESFMEVPGRDVLVHVWVGDDDLSVRANRWGNTYEPLTAWLTKHGIEWSEG